MKPIYKHKIFAKNYKKRILKNKALNKQFEQRLELFVLGVRGGPLNDHALKGKLAGHRAFSISGNLRVVYRETDVDYRFVDVGTHNQVYK